MPEILKWGEIIKAVQEDFMHLIELFDKPLLSAFENKDYGIYNHNLQNI